MPAANPGSGATIQEGFSVRNGPLNDATGYGGECIQMIAGAAINVGDAVYLSAASQVSAGVTGNNALRVGVCVGGFLTRGRTYPEVKIGAAATSASGQPVLVCTSGKVRGVAGAAVAVGDKLAFGAVAGRLITTAAAVGVILGQAITAAAGAASELDVNVAPF